MADVGTAKELFERFDGNRHYMALDGQLEAYEAFGVPEAVEAAWLEEIAAGYVARLDEPGNWKAVHFFWLHADCRHLGAVARQAPRGRVWERIAFLEQALDYAERCRANGVDERACTAAVDHVLSEAAAVRRACRSDRTRARVDRVLERASTSWR